MKQIESSQLIHFIAKNLFGFYLLPLLAFLIGSLAVKSPFQQSIVILIFLILFYMLHIVWRKKVFRVRMTEEQIEVKNKKWERIDWNEVRFVKFSWCQLYLIETNMETWYFAPNDIRFQIFPGIPISDDAFAKLMRKKGFDT